MKLVFAHDHKLRKVEEKYYTVGGLRDSITDRYFMYFDELTILCRVIDKQSFDTQLFEISNPKITVKMMSDGPLILNKDAKQIMEDEIRTADGLIVKLHSKIAEYAISYARKYNVPYLVEVVGCPWDAYWNHSLRGKFVAPLMTITTKREVRRAKYVIYVTKFFLQARYPSNGKCIDCSDVELLEIDEKVLEKRVERINNRSGELVVGTLAQLDVRYKGQEYVIRALSELKKNGIRIVYKVAGSGSSERLRNLAIKYDVEDQIIFCGVISHEDVFEWLDNIDFYIQPSKQEGLPRAMIEAISRGCPAAGSNVGGIGELIDKGYVFKKGNIKQIVNILKNLTKENLLEQAHKNFITSCNYDKTLLDDRRNKFYEEFASICKHGKH